MLFLVDTITMVPVMPRFILNIRKMHGGNLRNRLQSIDNAFGRSSYPIASRNAEVSGVVFAEGARDWAMLETQGEEEIQLDVIRVGGRSQ